MWCVGMTLLATTMTTQTMATLRMLTLVIDNRRCKGQSAAQATMMLLRDRMMMSTEDDDEQCKVGANTVCCGAVLEDGRRWQW